jgi:hypothetical protein
MELLNFITSGSDGITGDVLSTKPVKNEFIIIHFFQRAFLAACANLENVPGI